ncbi:DNA recombination protein RmuC, partial [Xanthomonas oryzae pv. oryzae]
MSSESLILLGLLVVVLVLQLLALLRRPSTTALEHALRAEQRDGRGELREQLEGL